MQVQPNDMVHGKDEWVVYVGIYVMLLLHNQAWGCQHVQQRSFIRGEDHSNWYQPKRLIKKIVWLDNKFTSIEVVRDQDPDEMSNWMNLILAELNQLQKTKAEKARFWITYGIPDILPQLNTLKCVVQVSIRASIFEGTST
jgi:hypothetical protein